MADKKKKVLIVEPLKKPHVSEIDSGLESLQKAVGGYIEVLYPWDDMAALVCNDSAKIEL